MGAFLDLAADAGAEVITPLFAMANPSGPVDDGACDTMTSAIVDSVARLRRRAARPARGDGHADSTTATGRCSNGCVRLRQAFQSRWPSICTATSPSG